MFKCIQLNNRVIQKLFFNNDFRLSDLGITYLFMNFSLPQWFRVLYWPQRNLVQVSAECWALLAAYIDGTGAHTLHGHTTYGDHIPSSTHQRKCLKSGQSLEIHSCRPTECCWMQPILQQISWAMHSRTLHTRRCIVVTLLTYCLYKVLFYFDANVSPCCS